MKLTARQVVKRVHSCLASRDSPSDHSHIFLRRNLDLELATIRDEWLRRFLGLRLFAGANSDALRAYRCSHLFYEDADKWLALFYAGRDRCETCGVPLDLSRRPLFTLRPSFCSSSCVSRNDRIKAQKFASMIHNFGDHSSRVNICRGKAEITNLERYGCRHPFQAAIVKERIRNKNLERRGVSYPTQDPGVLRKGIATCLSNYGVPNPSQSKVVLARRSSTHARNWVGGHSSRDPGVRRRTVRSRFDRRSVTIGTKTWTNLLGYEPRAIRIIVSMGVNPDAIHVCDRSFPYRMHRSIHGYLPDLEVNGSIVEVKSVFTSGVHGGGRHSLHELRQKMRAVERAGLPCRCLILDKPTNVGVLVMRSSSLSRSDLIAALSLSKSLQTLVKV